MGIFRNSIKKIVKGDSGQSMVEYILVLAVVGVLMSTVINSNLFKNFMSGDQGFFLAMRNYLESTYRYPYHSTTLNSSYSGLHDGYSSGGQSRFWGPKSPSI